MLIHDPEARTRKYGRGCGMIFFAIMLAVSGVWGALLGLFVFVVHDAEATIDALDQFRPQIGSKVFSADGVLLGEFTAEEIRQLVPLHEMPLHLQNAFVATEDHLFYHHRGVRPDAIINAALYIAQTGRIRGGSTITQQLVRNVNVTGVSTEQTVRRKIEEAIIALQLEREYTKDEILELYLNQIFLGISAYGVEAASWQYFAKSCRDVTLSEAAMLAGVVRAPNVQQPFRSPQNALARRNIVLGQMLAAGFITQEKHDEALAEDLMASIVTPERRAELLERGEAFFAPNRFKAPYFVEEVRKYLLHEVGLSTEDVFANGLQIYTTLDWGMQQAAEQALLPDLEAFDKDKRAYFEARDRLDEFMPVSGALVCLDNRPGYEGFVRAMVGGRDWETEKFNTATQARRQSGSSIKPFVWAAALENGYTAASIVVDEPFVRVDQWGQRWAPTNFDPNYLGPVTLRRAMRSSVNIVAIKLVEDLGFPTVASYLKDAGVTGDISPVYGLTIALGTPVTTVLDQAVGFSIFPNQGMRHEPVLVTEIRDRDGFILRERARTEPRRALAANTAYVVTSLLQEVCEIGTGHRTRALDRPRGGKTGTTNDSRDAWFAGFTRDFTAVVWKGYRDNRPLGRGRNFTGGAQASPVWTDFMVAIHQDLPVHDFEVPDGIDFFNINRDTGLAGGSFREAFITGTRPRETWPAYLYQDRMGELLIDDLDEPASAAPPSTPSDAYLAEPEPLIDLDGTLFDLN